MSDDWDQNFGERGLGDGVRLSLLRYDDNRWALQVSATGEPLPSGEVEQLRQDILGAAEAAGLTVTNQIPAPGEARIDPDQLLAARRRLARWRSENSGEAGHTVTTAELDGYTVTQRDEWLIFSPPGRASRVYLVSGDTVYSFSPAWETLDTAIESARAARG